MVVSLPFSCVRVFLHIKCLYNTWLISVIINVYGWACKSCDPLKVQCEPLGFHRFVMTKLTDWVWPPKPESVINTEKWKPLHYVTCVNSNSYSMRENIYNYNEMKRKSNTFDQTFYYPLHFFLKMSFFKICIASWVIMSLKDFSRWITIRNHCTLYCVILHHTAGEHFHCGVLHTLVTHHRQSHNNDN